MTPKELAVTAKVSFNFSSENTTEINKRLHVLKNAKLIQEASVDKYSLINRGKMFVEKLNPYYQTNANESDHETIVQTEPKNIDKEVNISLEELRLSSKDSSNPSRLEEALKEAFSLLGFKANLLGGPGNTDVLIEAPTTPKFSYSVAIDAKSSYVGRITEDQINFDTLIEHKSKHKANYSVVVGSKFQGKRLVERAVNNKVALMNLEGLEILIKKHIDIPLKSDSYKKIFSQS